jgi:D-lactate dehydrogenase
MIIYFVETEEAEQEFFSAGLPEHDLRFVDSLDEVAEDAEALSALFYAHITATFLESHPNLRFIAGRSSGYDHIDLAACRHHHVQVAMAPNYGDNTVAEHTFALILALSRRLRESMEAKQSARFTYESVRGFELKNKTLGVIGSGRVGLHVIRIAKAFGMRAVAYDFKPQFLMGEILGFEYMSLDELYAHSDIITLHIPLLPNTFHLLNSEAFGKCKRGVTIINTARGALIDTDALVEMLDNGTVRGVGLDVLEEERVLQKETMNIIGDQIVSRLQSGAPAQKARGSNPERIREIQGLMCNTELIARPNVVFTPHVAFNSVEALERINAATLQNIKAYTAGEAINLVGVE